jgi:hypothetical protein
MKELFKKLRKEAEQKNSQLSEQEIAKKQMAALLLYDKMQSPYDNAMNDDDLDNAKKILETQVVL